MSLFLLCFWSSARTDLKAVALTKATVSVAAEYLKNAVAPVSQTVQRQLKDSEKTSKEDASPVTIADYGATPLHNYRTHVLQSSLSNISSKGKLLYHNIQTYLMTCRLSHA